MDSFDEIKCEAIPYDFVTTKVGKKFIGPDPTDNLEAWKNYKTQDVPVPIIIWGSRKTTPIKEEYLL